MEKVIMLIFSILIFSVNSVNAIEGCNECHDDKWQNTPAHIWIDTEHHVEVVACVDCHSWKDETDMPPMLPSRNTLAKYCGECHHFPDELAEKLNMQQYLQMQD